MKVKKLDVSTKNFKTKRTNLKFITYTPDELPHETHLFGHFNGSRFNLRGTGIGKPHEGLLNTKLDSESGPLPFQISLLTHIAIMGYPTYSNYQKGGYDLFKISDGYQYKRFLKFECGGTMETNHLIQRHKTKMVGEFEVLSGKCDAPDLEAVEPVVETFYPAGKGKIESFIKGRWQTKKGDSYGVDIQSEYYLNHELELPFPHFRFIQISENHTNTTLQQHESLVVLNNPSQLKL